MRRPGLWFVIGLLFAPASAQADWPELQSGRVIAVGAGRAWLVPAQGRVVALPGAQSAAWSAPGRLVAIGDHRRLAVRGAHGALRWERRFTGQIAAPRWSSGDPVRLAFLAGRAVRVVAAAGEDVARLGRAADVAPAWRPGSDELALVRPEGDVVLVSAKGRALARWHPGRVPVSLSWTGDARHLVVSLRYSFVILDRQLRPEWSRRSHAILSAVSAPHGSRFAVMTVRAGAGGSTRTELELHDAERPGWSMRTARGATLFGRIVWSPDAHSLLVERMVAVDWLLVDVGTGQVRVIEPPRELLRRRVREITGWYA
jgi:hypothetical protein